MSRIAVVGGHGQVARLLHPLLVAAGHTPVALVRREGYREELEALGAEVRLLDLEKGGVEEYAAAFDGCAAVVFAAGGGPDGNVDAQAHGRPRGFPEVHRGSARRVGIDRFVQISAIGVDEPVGADAGDVWTAYVEAKRDADAALRASDLAWTIIRPGRLTDDPPTGLVALADDLGRGDVTRADVAAVVAAVLADDATVGRQWVLVGGTTPIPEAIRDALAD